MDFARGVAVAALLVAIVVAAVVLLGSGGGHEYKVLFQNAGQLVKDDDVQIGGRRIGSIRSIELTDDNEAEVTISVEDEFAPLHEGTTALIRSTSLSGIANRYIALTPGLNSEPALEDGAVLGTEKTTTPVDLDQLFNTLDPDTRRDLQKVVRGSATWYAGRGNQANAGSKYLNPALSASARLVNEVNRDTKTFQDFIVHSARVTTALAARRDDLANVVTNTNSTAGAIAAENSSLARALDVLPGTLRNANTTFVNLRATLGDLDVLVAESKPATRRLAPFLRELRPLVAAARPTVRDLRTLIRRDGKDNDLVELLGKTPRLATVAEPALEHSEEALRRSTPVLSHIRPYTPDLVGWIRDFGLSTSNYDANGHFARIQPIFNAFSFADNPVLGPLLTAVPPEQRLTGLQAGFQKRCPGAASQPAEDGSAPYRPEGLDCDPSQVLPGP